MYARRCFVVFIIRLSCDEIGRRDFFRSVRDIENWTRRNCIPMFQDIIAIMKFLSRQNRSACSCRLVTATRDEFRE